MGRIHLSVDAVDMQDILRRLDSAGQLRGASDRALRAGAEVVLRHARELAPVRTGGLKKALKVGRRGSGRNAGTVEVGAFYGDAPHAHLVEGGHGGERAAPPHPFLQPAAEMSEGEAIDVILNELKKSL